MTTVRRNFSTAGRKPHFNDKTRVTVNFTHQRPVVSIIIVTFNGRTYLENCLTALAAEVRHQDEIIIVDNNSDDGSPDLVANLFPQVKLFRQTVNHGFVQGCNYGAARAQGEVLVFLNQDTRVAVGWLSGLAAGLALESVGLTTSQVLLMSQPDKLHLAGQSVHFTGLVFGRGYGEEGTAWQRSQRVSAVSGASFAIKRQLWEQLNGMDELFFMYYEETDLSWRAMLHGYHCRYMPASVVYHDYQAGQPSYGRLYHTFRNRYLLLLKNYRWHTIILLVPALIIAELIDWKLALSQRKTGVIAKLSAHWWLVCHYQKILQVRKSVQRTRIKSDMDVLTCLSTRVSPTLPGKNAWLIKGINFLFSILFTTIRVVGNLCKI